MDYPSNVPRHMEGGGMSVGSLLLQVGKLRLRVGEWIRVQFDPVAPRDWSAPLPIVPCLIEQIDRADLASETIRGKMTLCHIIVRQLDEDSSRKIIIYKGGWTVPSVRPMYQGTFKPYQPTWTAI